MGKWFIFHFQVANRVVELYVFRSLGKLHFTTEENYIPYIPCRGEVWVEKQQGAGDIYQF